jgi:exodeoxyribonuclease V alpha subunit
MVGVSHPPHSEQSKRKTDRKSGGKKIEPKQVLTGTIKEIIVTKGGSWGVARLQQGNGHTAKFKGAVFPLNVESEVTLKGEWVFDSYSGGEVFNAVEVEIECAITARGLVNKLSELKDVGKQRAIVMVQAFGTDVQEVLRILRDEPERVCAEIPGISKDRATVISMQIANGWGKNIALDVSLLDAMPRWLVKKALGRWPGPPASGLNALEVISDDPYQLIKLSGCGFKKADDVAQKMGYDLDHPFRHMAALEYLINEGCNQQGHTWISIDDCAEWAKKKSVEGIRRNELLRAADIAEEEARIEFHPENYDLIISRKYAIAEETIVKQARRLSQPSNMPILPASEEYGLNEKQRLAVELVQSHRLLILTGGPGTGKTYTLQAILDVMQEQFRDRRYKGWDTIALCAPTGKAARRMQEMTGRRAGTVHQTLGYNGALDAFKYGYAARLNVGLVVCDEASMLDTTLAAELFASVPHDGRLLLVGDVDQLPSVGPGKVLQDLISSQKVPVVRLDQVMRQKEDSGIVRNAHNLINGQSFEIDNALFKDFKVFTTPEVRNAKSQEREATAQLVLNAHRHLREEKGYKLKQIQVLTPQKNLEVGTVALNVALREELNPKNEHKLEVEATGLKRSFRVGDRVIQTQNDYDLDVMNGEMGFVVDILPPDPHSQTAKPFTRVMFDSGQLVEYTTVELRNLMLAYAITVHKSQGSEWPCVIVPLSTSHSRTLTRRLLYTAITRGKELVVLAGTHKAINHARNNIQDTNRRTGIFRLFEENRVLM